jgi:hypothetical protein
MVGDLDWGIATGGRLTRTERIRLLAPILRTTVQYAAGRLRLALGLRPSCQGTLDLERLTWPDSALVRRATECCRETLSASMVHHSYRTFVFGLALAQLDHVRVDDEALLVAALMHDIALEAPTPRRCFAVVGAERTLALGGEVGDARATSRTAAEAVCLHVTPGLDAARHAAGFLISAGATIDLLGLRLWDMEPGFVARVFDAYPRLGAKRHAAGRWRCEARAVPGGRAALLEHAALFSVFIRVAPFTE